MASRRVWGQDDVATPDGVRTNDVAAVPEPNIGRAGHGVVGQAAHRDVPSLGDGQPRGDRVPGGAIVSGNHDPVVSESGNRPARQFDRADPPCARSRDAAPGGAVTRAFQKPVSTLASAEQRAFGGAQEKSTGCGCLVSYLRSSCFSSLRTGPLLPRAFAPAL